MDPALKQVWLIALRSGKYKQCKGAMKRGKAFCVMGLLQELCRKRNTPWKPGQSPLPTGYSSKLVSMNDEGVSFKALAKYIEEVL